MSRFQFGATSYVTDRGEERQCAVLLLRLLCNRDRVVVNAKMIFQCKINPSAVPKQKEIPV
jgi:hypothetical protein